MGRMSGFCTNQKNRMRLRRCIVGGGCVGLLLVGLGTGCGTFSDYPTGMNQVVLAPMDGGGHLASATKELQGRIEGRDEVLFALEAGRVAQLQRDYEGSRAAFDKAIRRTEAQGDEGVLDIGGAADQAAAVLVNDKAIEYRAPAYERTMLHHYQALNYLAENKLVDAGVEVRLANQVQEAERKRHAAAEDKATAKAQSAEKKAADQAAKKKQTDDEKEAQAESNAAMRKMYAGLNEVAGGVKTAYQNAATFVVSAVIWEMLGERNDAYIDYKKALEMVPEHVALQRAVFRLGLRLGMREDLRDLARRFPARVQTAADGSTAYRGMGHLVVLLEEDHVAQKQSLAIPYPISGALGMINLPIYAGIPTPPGRVRLVVRGGKGNSAATVEDTLMPLCRLSALASRALLEKMPGIVTRQVARAVAKGGATAALSNAADQQGAGLGALVELTMSIYNLASEQADLRSWLTLPDHIQMADVWAPAGDAKVELRWAGGGTFEQQVPLKEGRITLLYVTRANWTFYFHPFVQP